VKPEIASISQAANVAIPPHTRVSLTNTDAQQGYPISSFTWVIVYQEQNYNKRSKDKAESLVKLLWWMTHDGQKYTKPLDYAPLPDPAVKAAEDIITSITYDGEPVYTP
jgi:phosphate transport system substrate-binding protein